MKIDLFAVDTKLPFEESISNDPSLKIYNFIEAEQRIKIESKNDQHDFKYADHYEKDAAFYDYFEEYPDGASRHENRRLHEAIISELNGRSCEKILDVGCGNAWVAKHFLAKKKQVVSMDIASVNVHKALNIYPKPGHVGVVADVFQLPFKKDLFDVIIAAEIIEHVVDPAGFIKQLFKVLKPGGTLMISTPNEEKIKYSMCIHCNKETPQFAHLHSFSKKTFVDILENNFKKKEIKYAYIFTFSNKALIKLRSHALLKIFPFQVWKMIDKLSNFFYKKPTRLILNLQKN